MALLKKKEQIKETNVLTNQSDNQNVVSGSKDYTNIEKTKVVIDNKKNKYKYVAKNVQGDLIKGYFDAEREEDVKTFLNNEGYEVVSIKISKDIDIDLNGGRLSYSELSFVLTQLSTYLKAGIPLIESVRILERQTVKPFKKKIYSNIIYDLVRGENFSTALENQGRAFPKLLVNMVKTAEMTGDLTSVLDDMNEYYSETDKVRKAMVSAMIYPLIVLGLSILVIAFVLIYVVPRFVTLFQQNNAELPGITVFTIGLSAFLKNNIFIVIIALAVILIAYRVAFKNLKGFRRAMQYFIMHIPVFGNIVIYNEVAMFTKTFASLLSHNVFITESMEVLNKVSDNEIYKEMIKECLENLAKGKKISESFKGKWAFPIVAYEMLVTGENTGQLATMMRYVGNYYQEQHANATKRLNTFIEPAMIMFLAVAVGTIILSIIVPMFDFYQQISG